MNLQEYLNNEKEKVEAWVAEDPKNRWAAYPTTDLNHWESYGITTVAQYKRHSLESELWDLYKSVNGFRPRHMNISEMSDEELQSEIDSLIIQSNEEADIEAELQVRRTKAFEAKVQELIELGAKDRKTAIRWLRDSEDCDSDDEMEYVFGLSYGYLKTH